MKNRVITLCLIGSVSMAFIACGQQKSDIVEETPPVATEETVEDEQVLDIPVEEADSEEDPAEEADYSVFTDKSEDEVEKYAKEIKDAALAEDWDKIGDMIAYPIGSKEEGTLCENKEDFIEYATNVGFDQSYYDSLEEWSQEDLWANYQGAMLDNGMIWFSDIYVDDTNRELKIISFWGLHNS
ncbi:MAG: hypothetical protein J6Y86_03495 [Pseudobutyrivibrio sp.]|nr:hypothetical protein [Pseudobutyrivibrio sp.]